MKAQPFCKSVYKWFRAYKLSAAPLTGQDSRALHAFVHLVELWGNSDTEGRRCAIAAMRSTVRAMQAHTRYLAKRSIPHVLDWSHEPEIWNQLGLHAAHDDGDVWINEDEAPRSGARQNVIDADFEGGGSP